uniref:Uncharacterized protein n=1 Tax=Arion vulgaris TaxID=1028688 RepID=A0A0B7AYK8_9EUPU
MMIVNTIDGTGVNCFTLTKLNNSGKFPSRDAAKRDLPPEKALAFVEPSVEIITANGIMIAALKITLSPQSIATASASNNSVFVIAVRYAKLVKI